MSNCISGSAFSCGEIECMFIAQTGGSLWFMSLLGPPEVSFSCIYDNVGRVAYCPIVGSV